MERKQASQFTFGLLLIVIGLLMLGDQLNIGVQPLGIRLDLGRLWPLILIVIGIGRLVGPKEGRRGSGYFLIFLGVLFLFHTYHVMRLSQSWPLFIVAGGVSMLAGCRPAPGRKGA